MSVPRIIYPSLTAKRLAEALAPHPIREMQEPVVTRQRMYVLTIPKLMRCVMTNRNTFNKRDSHPGINKYYYSEIDGNLCLMIEIYVKDSFVDAIDKNGGELNLEVFLQALWHVYYDIPGWTGWFSRDAMQVGTRLFISSHWVAFKREWKNIGVVEI